MIDTSSVRGCEIGRTDSVERKHLFGDRLVLCEEECMGAGTGEGNPDQLEIRSQVHVLGIVAIERLSQIEDEVRTATRERVQRRQSSVQHIVERLVPKLLERVKNLLAVFFFPRWRRLSFSSGLWLNQSLICAQSVVKNRDFKLCVNYAVFRIHSRIGPLRGIRQHPGIVLLSPCRRIAMPNRRISAGRGDSHPHTSVQMRLDETSLESRNESFKPLSRGT